MVAVTRVHAEQVGHQRGQTLLRQQLVVQQIEHEGADPFAVLHRRGHPVGERRPRLRAARRTAAAVRAVLGDDQRLRFGQIEHLPGDMAGCHRRGQRLAARGTGRWVMVDGGIRRLAPAQRLARDGPSARRSSCRTVPAGCWPRGGFFSPSLDGGLPLLLLFSPRRRSNSAMRAVLRQQQRDEFVLRELVERFAIHQLLGIGPPKSCQSKCSPGFGLTPQTLGQPPQPRGQVGSGTWAVTFFEGETLVFSRAGIPRAFLAIS